MPAPAPMLDIDTCEDHGGDEWTVMTVGGLIHIVPQDTRHRLAREVMAWAAAGGTITNGEQSRRRRVRAELKENPALRVIVAEMAEQQSITPAQMRAKLVGHLGA